MRRKIQDLIQGKFEYDTPVLLFDQEELCFSVVENEDYAGSFQITSNTGSPVRGIVTCENPHIRIENREFEGTSAEIHFLFMGNHVVEGAQESGSFVITSNCGEYLIPYTASMTRHYLPTSIGKIKTLNDFVNLASLSWDEALKVFASPHFCNIFHENEAYYSLLYHGLTENHCSGHEMEEFLIAVGKKKRSRFSVKEKDLKYQVRDRSINGALSITKSEWGDMEISVSVDGDFIQLGKNKIHMYDFCGKHTELPFQITPKFMHQGRNFGAIILENCFQKEVVSITANLGNFFVEHTLEWKRRQLNYEMEKDYIAYRLGEKTAPQWKADTLIHLDKAKELNPDDRWVGLFRAYVHLMAGELDAADEDLNLVPRNMKNGKTPFGAFFHFLCAVKTGVFDDDFLKRMREIHIKHRKNPIVNWILLQTDESLSRNVRRKYQTICQNLVESDSGFFYLEAVLLVKKNPELLDSQDDFAYRIIGWMTKYNQLTREVSLRIQSMSQGHRVFNRSYLRVLSRCYKQFTDPGIVKTICTYLIHTNRYGEMYFPWFKRGMDCKLKIAGLYEAYLLSWSRSQGELPKEIIRYFSMNSPLPARNKAMLFAYIVRNKHRLGKDWDAYMVMVKHFALQELEKGHMNDDLVIIYEELRHLMKKEEWDQVKKDAEYCYKIHTPTQKKGTIRVLQNVPETVRQRVSLSGGQAFIYLYRTPYVVFYEDAYGRLYSVKDQCRMSKMLTGNDIYSGDKEKLPTGGQLEEQKCRGALDRLKEMAGSIDEMTELLFELPEDLAQAMEFAQQIMIRMLFTGYLGEQHARIFHMLLKDPEAEELLVGYAAVLSRSYLMRDYPLSEELIDFLEKRMQKGKRLNDWCRAALLKHTFLSGDQNLFGEMEDTFKKYLFDGKYFDFYELLPAKYCRTYLLMGIKVVTVISTPGQALYIILPEEIRASMNEVLPGIYTFPLRLLPGEIIHYTVIDVEGNEEVSGEKQGEPLDEAFTDTRLGKLSNLNVGHMDTKTQYEYAELSDMADLLFVPIKE